MTQTLISEKFYLLQTDEWIRALSELKLAFVQVLFYLRTFDPNGFKEIYISILRVTNSMTGLLRSILSRGFVSESPVH
jgi:hypothetical protein